MAKIYGRIESLKSLKSELDDKGITRFNSVKEIKHFLSNYDSEKLTILNNESDKLKKEYSETHSNLKKNVKKKDEIINFETKKIDTRISDLQIDINFIKTNNVNFIKKIISSIKLYSLKKQSNYFIKNKNELLKSTVKELAINIKNDEHFIKEYETEKQNLIEKRAQFETKQLEYTRNVLEDSINLISGAIGENLVVKEIMKLSDEYTLINDFNLSFSPPIFNPKLNHRIYTVQIDHVLISRAGIFIIETKNWSKTSVNAISMRSPVEQIKRSNFALYVYITNNITLDDHHWGEQKIPIRNLIVMINNKPKAEFKYVNIKLLRELNAYIKYFEPVLTQNQLTRITTTLTKNQIWT